MASNVVDETTGGGNLSKNAIVVPHSKPPGPRWLP
jgi:hypothetical protein